MAKEGSKCVDIAGIDDKHQITVVLTVSLDGNYLPVQLIFQGKMIACLPHAKLPSDWHARNMHSQPLGQ